jgi:hypothetical protein
MYFDVCEFLFTEKTREITIFINGERIKICEAKFGDTDLWIVLSSDLENTLQKRFRPFYPMFLGMLLSALHEKNAQTPILSICLDDVDSAYENQGHLQGLVNSIATGTYVSACKI